MKNEKASREDPKSVKTCTGGVEKLFGRSKRPLTAAVLAFAMAMVLFLPMTSGTASASVVGASEGDISWAENLGGDGGYEYFYGVAAAQDGGFVAVGIMQSSSVTNRDGSVSIVSAHGGADALIVKYDANGKIEWADTLGGSGWDYFFGVTAAPDGGFVAAGARNSTTLENSDGSLGLGKVGSGTNTLIVKYDAKGKIEWADSLGGGTIGDMFYGVTTTPDGGFAAFGLMGSATLENGDRSFSLGKIDTGQNGLIVKYDANGKIEWADNLGGGTGSNNFIYGATASPDGGFVAVGFMNSATLTNSDRSLSLGKINTGQNALIVKYDANGKIEWANRLGGTGNDLFRGVAAAPDGGFVAVGQMGSATLENDDGSLSFGKMGTGNNALIVKYDADGNAEWAERFGGGTGSNIFWGVAAAPDGGFAAAGQMGSATLENGDGSLRLERVGSPGDTLIVRYGPERSIEWADNLGGNAINCFLGVTAAPGGGFVAVGTMYSTTLKNSDGSFSIGKIGAAQDTLIVRYYGTPPEFAVTVTGGNVVSWSPTRVTYGDVNTEIKIKTGPGYRIDRIVSVFMGTAELTEGIDYVFEDGVLKMVRYVTGDLSVEVTTASGGGGETGGRSVTGGGMDLWWVLIAALSALSLLLLLGFIYKRRKNDQEG